MQRGVGLFGIGCLLVAATTASAQQASVTVFVGVHVVPMIQEQVLRNQTVVVTGDRITAIGPNGRVAVPEGATRIDGRGKFLMPRLTAPARPETVDPKKLADLVAATVAANVWNCPTLTVIEKVTEMDRWPALKAIALMRFVPPPVLAGWNPTLDFRYQDAPAERRAAAQRRFEFSLS